MTAGARQSSSLVARSHRQLRQSPRPAGSRVERFACGAVQASSPRSGFPCGWPAGPACHRSPAPWRSPTEGSDLTRPSGRLPGFSGGIQPGVVIYTYLATTNTRHSYVVAVLAGNLSAPSTRPHDADRAVSDQGSTHAGRTELIAALPGLQWLPRNCPPSRAAPSRGRYEGRTCGCRNQLDRAGPGGTAAGLRSPSEDQDQQEEEDHDRKHAAHDYHCGLAG